MDKKFLLAVAIITIISSFLIVYAVNLNDSDSNTLSQTESGQYPSSSGASKSYTYPIPDGQTCDITWVINVDSQPEKYATFSLSAPYASDSPKSASQGGSATVHSNSVTTAPTATVTCTRTFGCQLGYTLIASRSCSTPPTCTDECTAGQYNCFFTSAGTLKKCADWDGDGCTEWGGVYTAAESIAADNCNDDIDNDCDGAKDSADTNCQEGGGEDTNPPSVCVDNDGDGYGSPASDACTHSGLDCDDGDKDVHPGATEVCDGINNNCDWLTDEGCSCTNGATQYCGTDEGECKKGVQTCVGGSWGTCVGSVEPVAEVCGDAKDNDCDGTIDCSDLNCKDWGYCNPVEICNDSVNNDYDNEIDCDDSDCEEYPACIGYVKDMLPNVTLKEPYKGHKDTDGEIKFGYVASDDKGIKICSLLINNAVVVSDAAVPNGAETYFTAKSMGNGNYSWKVKCVDTGENEKDSEMWDFTVELEVEEGVVPPSGTGGAIFTAAGNTVLPGEETEFLEEEFLEEDIGELLMQGIKEKLMTTIVVPTAIVIIIICLAALVIAFMVRKAKEKKAKEEPRAKKEPKQRK